MLSRSAARVPRLATLSLLVAALLAACAGELGTQGEALRFLSVDLPDAPINEPYRAPVHAVGGLRPYEFRLETGSLPPGIQIVNGVLQGTPRSEEHTSELQSRPHLVCRLLLEKKKNKTYKRFQFRGLKQSLILILKIYLFRVIILIANILKSAFRSQLVA